MMPTYLVKADLLSLSIESTIQPLPETRSKKNQKCVTNLLSHVLDKSSLTYKINGENCLIPFCILQHHSSGRYSTYSQEQELCFSSQEEIEICMILGINIPRFLFKHII